MGSTSSATTCYFPPDVPATTISKCPQIHSLPAGCFAQQSEEMHIKGPQPPNPPFREVPHAHFQEVISPPCGLSRYCHLIIQRESQWPAQRMIPRFFCTWPRNQENGCKSQDFSHLNAKFHEKYTHQRFFLNFQHKTIKRYLINTFAQVRDLSSNDWWEGLCAVMLDNVRQIWIPASLSYTEETEGK